MQNLGKEISQTVGPVRASAEEFVGWLRKSVEKKGYCASLSSNFLSSIVATQDEVSETP